MQIERTNSDGLVINGLPDGSRVIVDSKNDRVFALNATAGAAWDACTSKTTLDQVADDMRKSFSSGVSDEVAEQAVLRLQEANLVTMSESSSKTTRREVLAGLSAVALPLVVSMTLAQQRAHAQSARSGRDMDDKHRPDAHVTHLTHDRL